MKMKINRIIYVVCIQIALALMLAACGSRGATSSASEGSPAVSEGSPASSSESSAPSDNGTKSLRIIATSDLHGKMYPWDYSTNQESTTGSLPQIATAISELRNENTLLLDAGDTIQGNSAELFVGEDTHPMMQALNYIGYDVWVTGNHEYNFGLDIVKHTLQSFEGSALTGNVYDREGNLIADEYTIIEKDGIRVAVIGMVTPNIQKWDSANLEGCKVTDPVEETRKILEEIKGQYDVLLGVMHMDIENELGVENSGVRDLAEACPEFDVIIASHGHKLVEEELISGVLVIENTHQAQTMSVIDLTLEKDEDGWTVTDKQADAVELSAYEPDPELMELLKPYHEIAKADAQKAVAQFVDDRFIPEIEGAEIPTVYLQDTALADLILDTQMYFSGADVASSLMSEKDPELTGGDVRKCDLAKIYQFSNTLYKLEMTGAQLKKYMEWSAEYYDQFMPGDQTVSVDPEKPFYSYDVFEGVNYEINVANPPGSRIENLTWPDGRPVQDDDTFTIAVNNYRASSQLLTPGVIFEEDDMPVLIESDVRTDVGDIREMIKEYIIEVKEGILGSACNNNWRITGTDQ